MPKIQRNVKWEKQIDVAEAWEIIKTELKALGA